MEMLPQEEWGYLIRTSWLVLIPVGLMLVLVLYNLMRLIHSVLDLLSHAKYELTPAMKDVRLTAEHVELLSRKAVDSVQSVEDGIHATGPVIQSARNKVRAGFESLVVGLQQSFSKTR